MNTQILKHITNYTISASNEEGIKLEGDFSINTENKIENYKNFFRRNFFTVFL